MSWAPGGGGRAPWLLAGLLGAAGVSHFVWPAAYASIVPAALGNPTAWVFASGLAELACGAGLALARSRRGAALATAALFVAVFPANLQMALDASAPGSGRSGVYQALAWGRLPVQVPLVLWALAVARSARTPGPGRPQPRRA